MHALIVVSHPRPDSLTHAVAARLAEGLAVPGGGHTHEVADLAAEAFEPRFTDADIATSVREAPAPADVLAEQARIDRADALVLVYPVYWWSLPGLLKGWIDRVFCNGWAYDETPGAGTVKKLARLPVHLVALGAASQGIYARHGYLDAMKTQIEHGIFDYCGARVMTSELLLASDAGFPQAHLEAAHDLGRGLFPAAAGSGR